MGISNTSSSTEGRATRPSRSSNATRTHRLVGVGAPDRGQTDALTRGSERATGDVIAFLNSDDYYLPVRSDASHRAGDERRQLGRPARRSRRRVRPVPRSRRGPDLDADPRGRATRRCHPGGTGWIGAPMVRRAARLVLAARSAVRAIRRVPGGHALRLRRRFMTRLALAGEEPVLLPDSELAAAVLHSGAKSADQSRMGARDPNDATRPPPAASPRERYRLRRIEFAPFHSAARRWQSFSASMYSDPLIRLAGASSTVSPRGYVQRSEPVTG